MELFKLQDLKNMHMLTHTYAHTHTHKHILDFEKHYAGGYLEDLKLNVFLET